MAQAYPRQLEVSYCSMGQKYWNRLKSFSSVKHSSLYVRGISDEEKKFYRTSTSNYLDVAKISN
jgi:hypothetical protein